MTDVTPTSNAKLCPVCDWQLPADYHIDSLREHLATHNGLEVFEALRAADEPRPLRPGLERAIEIVSAFSNTAAQRSVTDRIVAKLDEAIGEAGSTQPPPVVDDFSDTRDLNHADLLRKLPHVRADLRDELANLSPWALQRRVLIQADWLGHYSRCVDGLDLHKISGSGAECARDPRNIRRIVEHLRATPPPCDGLKMLRQLAALDIPTTGSDRVDAYFQEAKRYAGEGLHEMQEYSTATDRLPHGTVVHVCIDDIPRIGKRADCSVCSTATKISEQP